MDKVNPLFFLGFLLITGYLLLFQWQWYLWVCGGSLAILSILALYELRCESSKEGQNGNSAETRRV